MSPQLFSVHTERTMREVEEEQRNSEYEELSVEGTKLTELRYAYMTLLYSLYNTRGFEQSCAGSKQTQCCLQIFN